MDFRQDNDYHVIKKSCRIIEILSSMEEMDNTFITEKTKTIKFSTATMRKNVHARIRYSRVHPKNIAFAKTK